MFAGFSLFYILNCKRLRLKHNMRSWNVSQAFGLPKLFLSTGWWVIVTGLHPTSGLTRFPNWFSIEKSLISANILRSTKFDCFCNIWQLSWIFQIMANINWCLSEFIWAILYLISTSNGHMECKTVHLKTLNKILPNWKIPYDFKHYKCWYQCYRTTPKLPIRFWTAIGCPQWHLFQWPLLLTWFNFNPSMDK